MPDAVVHLTTTASMTVRVTVPDGLDEQETRDAAIEAAYNLAPGGVCAQCAGWDKPWSLDLGEWELGDAEESAPVEFEETENA